MDMETITDEDILAEVKARNLQKKIFTDDMIIAEVAMRGLGLQLLEKFPWGEIILPRASLELVAGAQLILNLTLPQIQKTI